MEKSIKNAFTYMFKDCGWKYKVAILTLLNIPSALYVMTQVYPDMFSNMVKSSVFNAFLFLILTIILLIVSLFAKGYYCKCIQYIHNSDFSNESEYLPRWEGNFVECLKVSLLLIVAQLFAMLALFLPFLLIIPALAFYFLMPALMNIFCVNFDVTSFLAWRKAFAIVKQNVGRYFGVIFTGLLFYIAMIVVFVGFYYLKKPAFGLIFPFIMAYSQLVYAYLYGILDQQKSVPAEVVIEEQV